MPPNPLFAKFDQALGKTTPTTGTPAVTSRADEIRSLAKTSADSAVKQQANDYAKSKQTISGLGSDIKDAATSGVEQVKQGYTQAKNAKNVLELLEGGTSLAAGAVNTALSPLAPIGRPVKDLVNATGNVIGDIPAVQKFANSKAGDITTRAVGDINNLNTIAGGIAGAKELPETISNIKEGATTIKNNVVDAYKNPPPADAVPLNETKINDLYNKAIKPSVSGKGNATQTAKANSNVISGLKTIADNKADLVFNGADGETITGRTPKSVDELNQAISQTKANIFKQYDDLATKAGKQGITVDGAKIGGELQPVIDSKALKIANPSAVQYAEKMQERLTQGGAIDAKTAQDVIQHFNETLKAFYKNPSYETASNASIDALVANQFRKALDEGISGATGKEYQQLKNQYGALSSMEKDVAHRSVVWGRQNATGLAGNIANIASGAELVRGLITMNPIDIGSSLVIKGLGKLNQYLSNPDVGVSRIFSQIEKSAPSSTGSK